MIPGGTIDIATHDAHQARAGRESASAAVSALVTVLAVFALSVVAGRYAHPFDADSMLRLVTVRDLLAGQDWFDPVQYRMGPQGGFAMHWSRFIDAPIAALIAVGNLLTGGRGETVAAWLWPALVMFAAIFALVRSASIYGGRSAVLPAAVLGAATLYGTVYFLPGAFDHHNVQLALALMLMLQFLDSRHPVRRGMWAGLTAALMMAIGMETILLVAFAGLTAAALMAFEKDDGPDFAFGFGLAFGTGVLAAMALTVSPRQYFAVACDALSLAHIALAALAGFGLAAASAATRGQSLTVRLGALAALALAAGVMALVFFPQCLADPYAALDPKLRAFWLDRVAEARPLLSLARTEPGVVAGALVTPLLALAYVVRHARREGLSHKEFILAAFLVSSVAVALWQMRGAALAVTIAAVPLATMIAGLRERASAAGAPAKSQLLMAAGWIVSVSAFWSLAVGQAHALLSGGSPGRTDGVAGATPALAQCIAPAAIAGLNGLPASRLMAESDLGPAILLHTRHTVVAGPYHRNTAGLLAAIGVFDGNEAQARAAVADMKAAYVVRCAGRVRQSPAQGGSFMRDLEEGRLPAWLDPIETASGSPFRIYRTRF